MPRQRGPGGPESKFQVDDELYIRLILDDNGRYREHHMQEQDLRGVPSFRKLLSRHVQSALVRIPIVSYIKYETDSNYDLIASANDDLIM